MAQIRRMDCQLEIKSSADKFFDAYRTKVQLMPKMSSQIIADIKLVQGYWDLVGSVRLWSFVAGGKTETVKEILESVDDKSRTIVFKLVEGDIINSYESWKSILNVAPKGEGSLVKWTVEFEKQNENIPYPVKYIDFLIAWSKNVDAYLLNA